ncbi:uncharacterized protein LOC105422453 [Pogonomyrmex barbatus]|uniref:Uncharacterized protein LOC105422453 n=1 Tax=Pogonomyrmex barbatus TaxID=144034 RepID=A0A6I9VNA8_9HYME|nr:uncharacterized protein LOC105422453 [Pogonomyrmex barbatus]
MEDQELAMFLLAKERYFGINKTLEKIRKRFYWAICKKDVEEWCRTCRICVAKKGATNKEKSPLQIFNSRAHFERIQMDILGPLPVSSSGNKYLLVVVDCFTKWVEAFPLKNMRATTAEIFVNQYLSKFIEENQKDWDHWIPMFLLAYRTSKHEATGGTPSELFCGRDLTLPMDLLRDTPLSYGFSESAEEYVRDLRQKLDEIHQGFSIFGETLREDPEPIQQAETSSRTSS